MNWRADAWRNVSLKQYPIWFFYREYVYRNYMGYLLSYRGCKLMLNHFAVGSCQPSAVGGRLLRQLCRRPRTLWFRGLPRHRQGESP